MNADPGLAYWKTVVADYEAANQGVKIDMQVYQNEDLRTKVRTALQSDNAPDLFQQWGGGELIDQVNAGYVMDLSSLVTEEIATIGEGNIAGWQVDGKTYGLPFTLGVEGIYYNQEMFQTAGITSVPKTLAELSAAVEKLKAAGLQPIAVGGQDGWPAAHWYFNFALRECTQATLIADATEKAFTDPCWEKAAQDLTDFAATEPFNDGWVTTSAQQGAGSSAGMLANGQAAMELMGIWEPGVVGSLAPDAKVPSFLGWFPFPSVPGGAGDQTAAMAGGDGFSCHKDAPSVCVDFLKYILSDKVQLGYAATGSVPSNPKANSGLTEPILTDITTQAEDVAYTQLWLDTVYGANVGTAINNNVVALLQGQYEPAAFVQAIKDAAGKS
jgi:ABC-type glycerol-3-phosphate transport system substrate-binding protein